MKDSYTRERIAFGKWLCKLADQGDRQWSPMRYVTRKEIEDWRDAECERRGVKELKDHRKNPHAYTKDRSEWDCKWREIWRPGYYRVEHRSKPSDPWCEYNVGGFPTHHANGVVKDFKRHLWIKESKQREIRDGIKMKQWRAELEKQIKQEKKELRQRQKDIERQDQIRVTRGITPDVETIAFFQTFATGACLSTNN